MIHDLDEKQGHNTGQTNKKINDSNLLKSPIDIIKMSITMITFRKIANMNI